MSRGRRLAGRLVPVTVSGFAGPVHVREDGRPDAPTLLLLHGFSGSLHWFDLALPALVPDFRIVRIDLLGHAGTGGPAVDAPVQARVAEAVLAHLDAQAVTAVGHSFGADVAVELAEISDRVERLVIVTQAPDYSDATLPRGNHLMTVPVLGAALARTFQGLATGVAALTRLRRRATPQSELVAHALADFRALRPQMFRVILADRPARMARRPLDAQVRAAGKPTLVLLGEKDHFYGARSAGRYAAAGAEVTVLPDAGHSPLVEEPAETAALIASFAAAARRG
jgi:pimeloyl-ACP methyl ester carboxylesterase